MSTLQLTGSLYNDYENTTRFISFSIISSTLRVWRLKMKEQLNEITLIMLAIIGAGFLFICVLDFSLSKLTGLPSALHSNNCDVQSTMGY